MIRLYHAWESYTSGKVRLCLEEKAIQWESKVLDMNAFENVQPDYLLINSNGQVPTLHCDGRLLPESSVINEFLEDRFPDRPLVPRHPWDRAQMRLWVRTAEEEIFTGIRPGTINLLLKPHLAKMEDAALAAFLVHHPRPEQARTLVELAREPIDMTAVDQTQAALLRTFRKLNAALENSPWLAGDAMSLADAAVAPVIPRVEKLGLQEIYAGFPSLDGWVTRMKARPAFQRAFPQHPLC